MPTFRLPCPDTSEESSTSISSSRQSERSYETAEEPEIVMSGKDIEMSHTGDGSVSIDQPDLNAILTEVMESNRILRKSIQDMEKRETENRIEMDRLRREMGQIIGVMHGPKQENQLPISSTNDRYMAATSNPAPLQNIDTGTTINAKPLKWPEPYDHKDQTQWAATYSLLRYIHRRDVVERRLLSPADFFTTLYSQAVTGNARVMVTGQFQDRMANGQIDDALGFLQAMDDTFRDRNAEQTAASLFYACKQFKDESLASFLPRFQLLLARSPSSSGEDQNKIYQLRNALNKTTLDYLVGRLKPNSYLEFIEYLSTVGAEIEEVGSTLR